MSPPLSRRRFFVGIPLVGLSLSGCQRPDQSDNNTNRTVSETPNTQTMTPVPRSKFSFDWSGALLHRADESHPPQIRLKLSNSADFPVELEFGPTPPFSSAVSDSSGSSDQLFLYHPEMGSNTPPSTPVDGCWQLESDHGRILINDVAKIPNLGPGDTVSNKYEIYNMPENGACFPDGKYVFESWALLPQSDYPYLKLRFVVTIERNKLESISTKEPVIEGR